MLGSLFRKKQAEAPHEPQGAKGARAYAIGDIHGRLDLLDELLATIVDEERRRPEARTFIILLGDLIDRGPDSAGVVERLRTIDWGYARPVFIAGNHEEMLLRILGDEPELVHDWLSYGGLECAQSYGVPIAQLVGQSSEHAVAMLRGHIPQSHIDFLSDFSDSFRFGDYLFVHAGIRPGVPIEQQSLDDLRWIREDFLEKERSDGLVVVHGHTIVTRPEERPGRIGIDTGAYRQGCLTALMIDGRERRFFQAGDTAGFADGPREAAG